MTLACLFLNEKFIKSNSGPVMKVVNNAINTNMAKISGPKIPKSYPMFKTISSISPLVFIKTPNKRDSFQVRPTIFAVMELPINLPRMAIPIIKKQNTHKWLSFKRPIWVRRPVSLTKNNLYFPYPCRVVPGNVYLLQVS